MQTHNRNYNENVANVNNPRGYSAGGQTHTSDDWTDRRTEAHLRRRLELSFESGGSAAFGPNDVLHLVLEGEEMRLENALLDLHESRQLGNRHRRVQFQVGPATGRNGEGSRISCLLIGYIRSVHKTLKLLARMHEAG